MKVLLFILMMNNPTTKWEQQGVFETKASCESAVRLMRQEAPHIRFSHVCTFS